MEKYKAGKKDNSCSVERTSKLGNVFGPVLKKIKKLIQNLEGFLGLVKAWINKEYMEPSLVKPIDMGLQKSL